MRTMLELAFATLVLLACLFALVNGFIDGGGLVSTVVTTRILDPLPAVLLVAFFELTGLLLLGHAVTRTVGQGLIAFPSTAPALGMMAVVMAALLGATLWNIVMWRMGFPSSSSHALIGGLAGAALAAYGWNGLSWPTFLRVFVLLGIVPALATLLSYVMAKAVYWVGEFATPAVGALARYLNIGALVGMAMVHGSNDGQKAVGIILLGSVVLTRGDPSTAGVPLWMFLLCGSAIGLGVIFGSRRTLQTVGKGIYRVQVLQGLCAESSAMLLVGASSLAGVPMSTTHVMSTSVLGAGVARQPRGVRWSLVGDIGLAWLSTIPAAALVAALWVGLFKFIHVVP